MKSTPSPSSNNGTAPLQHGRAIIGSGEMAALVRAHDWSSMPLGSIEGWSEACLTIVNLVLSSPYPAAVCWGPDLKLIYNDGFRPFTGEKHPGSLGQPAREVWKEAWQTLGPQFEAAFAKGETTYLQNFLIPLYQNGRLQDFYWTYSFSPVYDNGQIFGLFVSCQNTTEQVLATRKLHESEARASRILQSIGDAVIVTDAENHVGRMNPVAEALTGWTIDEAEGQPLAKIFHIVNEATRQIVESPAEKVRRLGSIVGLANHTVLIRRDGTETPIDDSGAPIPDDEGELSGIVLVFRDISEKRAAERERAALAQQLQQVLEVTTDSILSIDRNWRITYMNPPAMATASPIKDAVGRDFWESFPATVYEGSPYVEHYHRAMNERVAGEFEAFYPEPLNIWVQVQVRPAQDGIVLFFRNVTEQKRSDEERSENEMRLRLATEAAELGIFVWHVAEDRVTWENDRIYEIFGRTREDGSINAAEFATQIVHPDYAAAFEKAVADTLQTGARFYFQGKFHRKDGTVRWVELTGQIEYEDDGSPLRMLGTVLDITTRKQSEEALRTTEKLAAVGRLAASIAHEINNPLESVTNLLYLARQGAGEPDLQSLLNTADQELRRVSLISSQTLRFHKQATNAQAVSCLDLFTTVLSIYEGRLRNSNITIEKRKRACKPVVCFEGEIRQVLNNLIGNAIDAMQPSGGRLLIRSREATDWATGRQGLMLTVADTGPGISPHTLRKIFEPFFTTKGIGGTGLGLWISQEIVARHHGELRVRSSQQPDSSGTVFTLFLPFDAVSRSKAT